MERRRRTVRAAGDRRFRNRPNRGLILVRSTRLLATRAPHRSGADDGGMALDRAARLGAALERDGATCIWCGRAFAALVRPTTEHVVPRVKGGPSWPENEVAACRRCNSERGHRGPGRVAGGVPAPRLGPDEAAAGPQPWPPWPRRSPGRVASAGPGPYLDAQLRRLRRRGPASGRVASRRGGSARRPGRADLDLPGEVAGRHAPYRRPRSGRPGWGRPRLDGRRATTTTSCAPRTRRPWPTCRDRRPRRRRRALSAALGRPVRLVPTPDGPRASRRCTWSPRQAHRPGGGRARCPRAARPTTRAPTCCSTLDGDERHLGRPASSGSGDGRARGRPGRRSTASASTPRCGARAGSPSGTPSCSSVAAVLREPRRAPRARCLLAAVRGRRSRPPAAPSPSASGPLDRGRRRRRRRASPSWPPATCSSTRTWRSPRAPGRPTAATTSPACSRRSHR